MLAAAILCIDADGTICVRDSELAELAGVHRVTVQKAWRRLEAYGLVHRNGKTNGLYRYVDPRVCKALERPVSRRTHDVGWREVRARNGGLERAVRQFQREREVHKKIISNLQTQRATDEDLAAKALESLRAEASQMIEQLVSKAKAQRSPTTDSATKAARLLQVEGRHALECLDGPEHCERCLRFQALTEPDTELDEIAEVAP